MKKQTKIKNLIRRTRDKLTWELIDTHEGDTLEIVTDYWKKTHTIYTPTNTEKKPLRDIEYLHELGHAVLCETVHPGFSTHYYAQPYTQQQLCDITPAMRAASDWFVDAWLMQKCADEERAEIEEHYNMVANTFSQTTSGPPEAMYGGALMIAQGIKYCGAEIQCGGVLGQAVAALLSVPPDPPTIENFEALTNKLIAILHPLRISRIEDDGVEIWQIHEN